MTPKEAHRYVEDLQRMLTQYRFHFSEKFIEANGVAVEALEKAEKYAWHDLRKNPNDLPEHLKMVNVAWVNRKPAPYYSHIKDKPFEASAVCFHGEWYWWSVFCEDMLSEYGRNDADGIDDGIEIIAWREIEPFEVEE